METTQDEKGRIREIIQHLIRGDERWFADKEISVGNKAPYWILNYNQGPRNEYNKLVRGMVVQQPDKNFSADPLTLIKSFPFMRFFNQAEEDADDVNLGNAEMLEKLDGTMVGVFFPKGDPKKPEWHTRKMLSTSKQDSSHVLTSFSGKQYPLIPLAGKYVKALNFSEADVPFTYVFEFIHEASQVITKYAPGRYGLYLLAARNVQTHKEASEQELDHIAVRINAGRPRRWDAVASGDEIAQMMNQVSQEIEDFEGFVFRDKSTGKRIKLKDENYLKKHRLLDKMSGKNLLPLMLQGEEEEVIAYFPHAKKIIDRIKDKYNNYLDKIVDKVKEWQSKDLNKKELANKLFGQELLKAWERRLKKMRGEEVPSIKPGETDPFLRDQILSLYGIKDESQLRAAADQNMRRLALGLKDDGRPTKLLDIIGFREAGEDVGEA